MMENGAGNAGPVFYVRPPLCQGWGLGPPLEEF